MSVSSRDPDPLLSQIRKDLEIQKSYLLAIPPENLSSLEFSHFRQSGVLESIFHMFEMKSTLPIKKTLLTNTPPNIFPQFEIPEPELIFEGAGATFPAEKIHEEESWSEVEQDPLFALSSPPSLQDLKKVNPKRAVVELERSHIRKRTLTDGTRIGTGTDEARTRIGIGTDETSGRTDAPRTLTLSKTRPV